MNALDLSHCAEWEISPLILKRIYYFPDGGSVDYCGVIVVVILSPKEEE